MLVVVILAVGGSGDGTWILENVDWGLTCVLYSSSHVPRSCNPLNSLRGGGGHNCRSLLFAGGGKNFIKKTHIYVCQKRGYTKKTQEGTFDKLFCIY